MKTIFIALIVFLITSCSGVLYTGITESRQAEEEKDTVTITITFTDPMLDACALWLEYQQGLTD